MKNILTKAVITVVIFVLAAGVTVQSAYAAVPVAVVGMDTGTDFEFGFEGFLYHLQVAELQSQFELFMNLAQREEDFTAAFELTRIEKAREDVNKLIQETIQEMENAGTVWHSGDILSPDVYPNATSAETLRGTRIINSPQDYLVSEPMRHARLGMICTFLHYIWDQRGWLIPNSPVTPEDDDPPKATYGLANNNNSVEPADTEESVAVLRQALGESLISTTQGMEDTLYSYFKEQAIFLDEDVFNNEGSIDRQAAQAYCDVIFENYGIPSPSGFFAFKPQFASMLPITSDPALSPENRERALYKYIRGFLALPSLKLRAAGRKSPTREEMAAARKTTNQIAGAVEKASSIGRTIGGILADRHKTDYEMGQGIRPENFYISFKDPDSPIEILFETRYIVSPTVVLLQKMQAATQAQFDLAQKGFLYIPNVPTDDPDQEANALKQQSIMGAYNLERAVPQPFFESTADNYVPFAGSQKMATRLSTVQAGGESGGIPAYGTITSEQFGFIVPWIKPGADTRFISAAFPGATVVVDEGSNYGYGLPAPWEDVNNYVRLNKDYRVTDYRPGGVGDNIGNKLLGTDFAINDWYDRVLEMYEPSGNPPAEAFSLLDWKCLIRTWFNTEDPADFNAACGHRLNDRSY